MPHPDLPTLLREIFGFDGFRPGQGEIVEAILQGRDVLAIMPTGGGKSLCFQLPALARDGLTVVISPLIALMRDQVAGLRQAGVEAGALTSANDAEENARIHQALEAGTLRLLYLAPERLPYAGSLLRRAGVNMIAVDEAHCVSQWGHDFRPDYLRIGELRDALGGVQVAAFTATADAETREEIARRLFPDAAPETFLRGFDRPNLHLAFEPKTSPRQQLLSFVKARKGRAGIVYCSSRNKTEVLAQAITDAGIPALAYHAGLESETRAHVQDRFQREDDLVICATVAFGMGVDKPDIRWVAHADLPKSVESYYQEIGRAGRDGAPADTLTLYGDDDFRLRRAQIDESPAPWERKVADFERLDALIHLAEAHRCRRAVLLEYFGDSLDGPCGNCDLCQSPPDLFDGTEPAQKALSAVYRTGEMFGAGHVIRVLRGEGDERTRKFGHETLSVWGCGQEMKAGEWKAIFRQLHALGLVKVTDKLGWMLTEKARPVLRGEERLELRRDVIKRAAAAKGLGRGAAPSILSEEDEPMFNRLRGLRRRLAEDQGVPPYVVFADRTLIDMCVKKPASLDAMAGCTGVGAKKLELYGAAFLAEINESIPMEEPKGRIKAAARGDGALYDALRAAQVALGRGADGTGKPMSCTNRTLALIAEEKPASLEALERVSGMGPQKAERFGEAFLRLIGEHEGG